MKRVRNLSSDAEARWGKMGAAEMLWHCACILRVAYGELSLPKINIFLSTVGIFSKKIMCVFNNGIPRNMPTFAAVKPPENCIFDDEKANLENALQKFCAAANEGKLVAKHPLFGRMSHSDWGFLEYKHIDHHLKQFGV